MATSPVVIPGAVTKLAEAVPLDLTALTAQTLLTVPNGMRAVVTGVHIRDFSGALTGTAQGNMVATLAFTTAGALPVAWISAANTFTTSTTGAFTVVAAAQTSAGVAAGSGAVSCLVQSIASATAATATKANPLARGSDTLTLTLTYSVAAPAAGTTAVCDVVGYLEAF